MTLAMKDDEAFNPVKISFLGAQAVVPAADLLPDLLKQPGRSGR